MPEQRLAAAIVGAGTAGLYAASRISRATDDFLLFEGGIEGTTCARVGCMPSKAIISASQAFACTAKGAAAASPADSAAVLAQVRQVRDALVSHTAKNARARFGEKIRTRTVHFIAPMTLFDGETSYACERIVLACGSTPAIPPGWRLLPGKIITTDQFFELTELGRKVLVLGLGPVGIELSQAMAGLGIEVVAAEMTENAAAIRSPAILEMLLSCLGAEKNLKLLFRHKAVLVSAEGRVRAELSDLGTGKSVIEEFDQVLLATGRKPNAAALKLENSGLILDARSLPVFDGKTLATQDGKVFLAGDFSVLRPFFHDAADQGILAGQNAVAKGALSSLPEKVALSIVFTHPNVVQVGRTPADPAAEGLAAGTVDFADMGRAKLEGGKRGRISLYFSQESRTLSGAELVAPEGEHMGHFLAACIQARFTVEQMLSLPYYHPTYEELIQGAVDQAKRLMRS
ncbi:MAG: FAD-dependent oxidoreductase [Thermodesulfobacteriota bacterium]